MWRDVWLALLVPFLHPQRAAGSNAVCIRYGVCQLSGQLAMRMCYRRGLRILDPARTLRVDARPRGDERNK